MTQHKKTKRILLAVGCVLVAMLTIAPAASLAQGPAADEYDLGPLPKAGGESGAGESSGAASIAASSSDAGGVPVLLIVLVAVAAACTAAAIWRMRTSRTS
jgi:hypothetical protein